MFLVTFISSSIIGLKYRGCIIKQSSLPVGGQDGSGRGLVVKLLRQRSVGFINRPSYEAINHGYDMTEVDISHGYRVYVFGGSFQIEFVFKSDWILISIWGGQSLYMNGHRYFTVCQPRTLGKMMNMFSYNEIMYLNVLNYR